MTKPLEVEGLGYDLPGRGKGERRKRRSLVRDVAFTVGAGETLVLLGRSGSGKTTTLKLINRLLEPTSGEVRVAGERAADLPVTRLRRRIGYVIQEVGLFPHFTVERNRSEEHTSELQSQSNLVCRLLLEKKKEKSLPRHTIRLNSVAWRVT